MIGPQLLALAIASVPDRVRELLLTLSDSAQRRRPRERSDAETAVHRGLAFLRRRQGDNGEFRGFMLLPGASTHWLTAHVALVLEPVADAEDISRAAATFLSRALESDGPCGYNSRVGADCDTTAQALSVVHRFGLTWPRGVLSWLEDAQSPEGGFPTFPPPDGEIINGWQVPQPDVSLMVILALERLGRSVWRVERARQWLSSQPASDMRSAYWWPHEAYRLWAEVRADFEPDRAAERASELLNDAPACPWDAMLIAVAAASGPRPEQSLEHLLDSQAADGSWPCAPCLRVTDPRHIEPGPFNAGRIHADRTRIFSTAHAVAALSATKGKQVAFRVTAD